MHIRCRTTLLRTRLRDGEPRDDRVVPRRARRVRTITDAGVTLVEAMMVVAIVGILVAVAAPSFSSILANHRAAVAANDVLHAFTHARSEAMRRGRRVTVAPLGARWRDGWAVFVDRDDDRRFDPAVDELIVRHDALSPTTSVTKPSSATGEPFTDVGSPPRAYVAFDGNGFPRQRNGGFLAGSMTFTDRSGGSTAVRTLCLAAYGRIRIAAAPACT